ncbi:helix-turn-helix transcriptional regulator [Cryobacterium fucosi]|jgi:prophage regulatory protein|uniref:AlpA family phage regulatory protein n=1 Tax=Cryobacterium fucosi TaxID=1259157 RepID=A0A4R9BCD4_9MICO|nr:AlpA family phage regulatory protein [Cryobacterium fucosi]
MTVQHPRARPIALLTAKDLSAQTGMSMSTIYRKRSTGESLPRAVKLGGHAVRWRQSDVDSWIEEQLEPEAR